MRYILEGGLGPHNKDEALSFDGEIVIFENGDIALGFKDNKGGLHIYKDDTCSSERLAPVTLDPTSLVGVTITAVTGMKEGSHRVQIETTMGKLNMQHDRHCCEVVELVDVCGSPEGLVGGRIVVFETRTGTRTGKKIPSPAMWSKASQKERIEGWRTYTFYEIRTTRGDVTLRWGQPDNLDDNRYGEEITLSITGE